jgi:heme/copper-type cytochrome/quinol oxidase subunit 4
MKLPKKIADLTDDDTFAMMLAGILLCVELAICLAFNTQPGYGMDMLFVVMNAIACVLIVVGIVLAVLGTIFYFIR